MREKFRPLEVAMQQKFIVWLVTTLIFNFGHIEHDVGIESLLNCINSETVKALLFKNWILYFKIAQTVCLYFDADNDGLWRRCAMKTESGSTSLQEISISLKLPVNRRLVICMGRYGWLCTTTLFSNCTFSCGLFEASLANTLRYLVVLPFVVICDRDDDLERVWS